MQLVIADNDLIEQIVANVLAELQPAPSVRAPVEQPLAVSKAASAPLAIELDAPVITADLLAERVRHGQSLRIGRKSILTPSARDWLSQRKIAWSQSARDIAASPRTAARWQLVITTVTPAIATLRPSLADWKPELLGTPQEAAESAVRTICTGETDGVLAFCQAAESLACLANRNVKVRAAVLHSLVSLPELVAQLNPNLLVINPKQKSFMELKNTVRAVGALSKPSESYHWASGK